MRPLASGSVGELLGPRDRESGVKQLESFTCPWLEALLPELLTEFLGESNASLGFASAGRRQQTPTARLSLGPSFGLEHVGITREIYRFPVIGHVALSLRDRN